MKKFAALLFAAVMVAATALGLCACDSDHVHVYGQEVIREATCYSEGEVRLVCLECGDVRTIVMPIVPHSFTVWEVVTEVTCNEDGLWKRRCTMCGLQQTGEIPARGHDWGEWEIQEATCEMSGLMVHKCTRCEETEARIIGALGHLFDTAFTIDKHPTKTQDGQRSRHCLRPGCNAVTDVEIIHRLGGD